MDAERIQIDSIIEDNYRIIANYKNKWLLAEAVDKKKLASAPYMVFDVTSYRYDTYRSLDTAQLAFTIAACGKADVAAVDDVLGHVGKNRLEIGRDGKFLLNGNVLYGVISIDIKNINLSEPAEVAIRLDLQEIDIQYKLSN